MNCLTPLLRARGHVAAEGGLTGRTGPRRISPDYNVSL